MSRDRAVHDCFALPHFLDVHLSSGLELTTFRFSRSESRDFVLQTADSGENPDPSDGLRAQRGTFFCDYLFARLRVVCGVGHIRKMMIVLTGTECVTHACFHPYSS